MFQGHEKHKSDNPLDGLMHIVHRTNWIRSYNDQVVYLYFLGRIMEFSTSVLLGSQSPDTAMNYVWSMANA